jgi:hypothetical protein
MPPTPSAGTFSAQSAERALARHQEALASGDGETPLLAAVAPVPGSEWGVVVEAKSGGDLRQRRPAPLMVGSAAC